MFLFVLSFFFGLGPCYKKKKNEEANEEAKRALEEYEEWENSDGENSEKAVNVSGRRVFGATAKVEAPKESRKDSDNFYDDSDSDNDMAGIEDNNIEPVRDNASPARNTITETEVSYFFIMGLSSLPLKSL